VIASSFSANITDKARDIRVRLSRNFLGASSGLKVVRYRASDNVYSAVRGDLAAAGNLKPEFLANPLSVAEPLAMAREQDRARVMVHQNWTRYVAMMKRDLKWRTDDHQTSFDGRSGLQTKLEQNELVVVEST
jgi:hypothetical protein